MKVRQTFIGLLVAFIAVIGLALTVYADGTVTPKEPPSGNPIKGLFGGQLIGGFTQQPANVNTISEHPFSLTVSSVDSTYHFFSQGPQTQWYLSTDGHSWTDAGQSNQATYTTQKKVTQVTTLYYQASATYSGFLGPVTFWSQVAKVIISPGETHATAIAVNSDNDTVPNGMSTNMRAVLTPVNATDVVTWSVDKPDIATIDSTSGTLTANADTKKYGQVVVTAKTANGLTASKIMYIGALQDLVVNENDPATFTVKGFPKGASVVAWHQVTPNGQDTVLSSNANLSFSNGADGMQNAVLHIKAANAGLNNNKYYADIKMSNVNQNVATNLAQLVVIKSTGLTLDAVPNFTFAKAASSQGQVKINDILSGITLHVADRKAHQSTTAFDGNNENHLIVSDTRSHSTGWSLMASLSTFTNSTTGQTLGSPGNNRLTLVTSDSDTLATLTDNNQNTSVKQATSGQNLATTLSNSTLTLVPTVHVSSGVYDATITWTLANVPDPGRAK